MSWRQTRLKHLCTDAGQYGLNISADQYTQSGSRLIRTSDISESGQLAADGVYVDVAIEARHRAQSGDLLLSRSGTLGRSFLVPPRLGDATYAGYLVRFRPRCDVEPRFLAYAAQSAAFQDQIRADAVSSTIQNFSAERYASIGLPAPNLDEQRRIADFLDAQLIRIATIDTYLASASQLLAERRVSIWWSLLGLGSAPSSSLKGFFENSRWSLAPLKAALRMTIAGATPTVSSENYWSTASGTPWISISDMIEFGTTDRTSRGISDEGMRACRLIAAPSGTVLMAMYASLGKTTVTAVPATWNQAIIGLVPQETALTPEFLLHWLEGLRQFLPSLARSNTQDNINAEQVRQLPLILPSLSEQRRILQQFSGECDTANVLVSKIGQQCKLLAERRQALITAAVTGQIDVTTARGADG